MIRRVTRRWPCQCVSKSAGGENDGGSVRALIDRCGRGRNFGFCTGWHPRRVGLDLQAGILPTGRRPCLATLKVRRPDRQGDHLAKVRECSGRRPHGQQAPPRVVDDASPASTAATTASTSCAAFSAIKPWAGFQPAIVTFGNWFSLTCTARFTRSRRAPRFSQAAVPDRPALRSE